MVNAKSLIFAVGLCWFSVANARADLVFGVSFTQQAQANLSVAQQGLFVEAVSFWDAIIVGHRDNVSRSWNLTVDTFSQPASGGAVLLGSGAFGSLGLTEIVPGSGTSDGRFYVSTSGLVTFNVHPDAGPLSGSLIRHEIAHALGFGTLWELNQVYNDGVAGNSFRTLAGGIPGQYVGQAALQAYRQEFSGQANASFVPVELSGGNGTAHGHWDEANDIGQSLTGITDAFGRDFRDELMTGWASPTGADVFISDTTINSFYDIGFRVQAIPEPSGGALIALASLALFYRRSNRSWIKL
jgi:hypothetical protein